MVSPYSPSEMSKHTAISRVDDRSGTVTSASAVSDIAQSVLATVQGVLQGVRESPRRNSGDASSAIVDEEMVVPSAVEALGILYLKTWHIKADTKNPLPDLTHFTPLEKEIVYNWLYRLTLTNDFRGNTKDLAQVVCSMLETTQEHTAFKVFFIDQIAINNTDCEDHADMGMNELYTAWKLMTLPETASVKDKLNILIAGAKTHTLRQQIAGLINQHEQETKTAEEESAEIHLYYEIRLKERLGLLTIIQSMENGHIGLVSWIDPRNLISIVEKKYVARLIDFPLFQDLAMADPACYESINACKAARVQQLELLERQQLELADEALSDTDYQQAVDRLVLESKLEETRIFTEWFSKAIA